MQYEFDVQEPENDLEIYQFADSDTDEEIEIIQPNHPMLALGSEYALIVGDERNLITIMQVIRDRDRTNIFLIPMLKVRR